MEEKDLQENNTNCEIVELKEFMKFLIKENSDMKNMMMEAEDFIGRIRLEILMPIEEVKEPEEIITLI